MLKKITFHKKNINILKINLLSHATKLGLLSEAQKELISQTPASMNISFIPKRQIQTLKKKYLGINEATDILSFPSDPFFREHGILGEMLICREIAQKQADFYGHSLEVECVVLIVHGFLHLLGYDHMTLKDRTIMCYWEEELLRRLLPETQDSLIKRSTSAKIES